jgi:transposase
VDGASVFFCSKSAVSLVLPQGANIKLSSVLTDIMGVSGRAMVEALITGTDSAETIAELARGPLRRKHNDPRR